MGGMIPWLFSVAIVLGIGYALFWLFRSFKMMGFFKWSSPPSPSHPPRPSQVSEADTEEEHIIPAESLDHIKSTAANLKAIHMEWSDISLSQGQTTILHNVHGQARSGEMLALMGASGAGKSSLLGVLAMRSTGTQHQGSLLFSSDGVKIKRTDVVKLLSYVPQEQHLPPQMTCLEVMTFYSGIKGEGNNEREVASKALSALGLGSSAHTLVGGSLLGGISIRGLSGGEQKRLSIAVGLISNPSLLLVDEPTSGLDSFASLSVMAYLKALAESGRTVIASIHQPRAAIWEMFDSVLLLAQGQVMFIGRCDEVAPWFQTLGFEYRNEDGLVCDFMIDLVQNIKAGGQGEGETSHKVTDVDGLARAFEERQKQRQVQSRDDIESQCLPPQDPPQLQPISAPADPTLGRSFREKASQFKNQFLVLYKRESITALRNPTDVAGRMLLFTTLGIISNFIVVNARGDASSISQRIVWLFAQSFFYLVIPYTFLSLFVSDKRSFMEDSAAKVFSVGPWYIAKAAAVTPSNVLIALVFQSIAYGMIGFRHQVISYLQATSCAIVLSLISLQWMQLAVAITPNQDLAFAISIAFTIANILFSSVFLTSPAQQADSGAGTRKTGWIFNLRVLSALEWSFEGGMIAEFKDRIFACPLTGPLPLAPFNVFPEILSSTNPFLAAIKSGLTEPIKREGCVAQGNAILAYFSIQGSAGSKLGVLLLYLACLHVLTFVALWRASRKTIRLSH